MNVSTHLGIRRGRLDRLFGVRGGADVGGRGGRNGIRSRVTIQHPTSGIHSTRGTRLHIHLRGWEWAEKVEFILRLNLSWGRVGKTQPKYRILCI